MDSTVIMLVTAAVFGWGVVSKRLARADLTAPIVFIVVGALLAWAGLVDGPEESAALTPWSRSPWSGCCSRMPPAYPFATYATTWAVTPACSASACL